MTPTRIVIDTDPGVDDALTFLLALASPEIQLEALTTVSGNIGIEKTTRNALSVLELAHASHIPVARGCSLPLVSPPHKPVEAVHGASGVGKAVLPEPKSQPINQHAIDYLIERILAEPQDITLFTIGPMTNLALAIRKEPRIAQALKELVIMGGAIRSGGNVTPLAEFNIHADPHAAHIVFHSGIPITLIPLDVTYKCLLTTADIERLNRIDSPVARFVRDATAVYMDFYKKYEGFDGCALHDPLTLAVILAPELFTFEEHHVDVDISGGISTGKTFADFMKVSKKPANMKVALDVRGRDFIEFVFGKNGNACMTEHIILDTDPGIDDSLAILLALASPEISLDGLSVVHGNSSTEQGTINALSVLELAKASHIPVYQGCELPLVQPSLLATETHGAQGIGYAKLPAPQTKPRVGKASDYLIEKIISSPKEITLVCIGPLTNVAMAIGQEPRIVENVKEVFIMGGAIRHEGNTTPLAEFNTFVDPHAAHIVYHSGMPITLTPLDVSYECIFLKDDLNRLLKIDSPITKFISDATRFYMEFHDEYQKIEGCVINDPLTMALTFMPEICDYQDLYVDVDISTGVGLGNTFADFYNYEKKTPNMKVALGVRPRIFMELFLERMEKLAREASLS